MTEFTCSNECGTAVVILEDVCRAEKQCFIEASLYEHHEIPMLNDENKSIVKGTGMGTYKDEMGREHDWIDTFQDWSYNPENLLMRDLEEEERQERKREAERKKEKRRQRNFLRNFYENGSMTEIQKKYLRLMLKGKTITEIAKILRKKVSVVHQGLKGRKTKEKRYGGLFPKMKREAKREGFNVDHT